MNNSNKRKIKIIGSGMAIPSLTFNDFDFDQKLNLPIGSTFRRTGVRRRFLSQNETAAQLAAQACQQALKETLLNWEDIDCLVACCGTMDQAIPYNAAVIHAELGLNKQRTTTLDIGATCLSFLMGLDVMSYLVENERYKNVMIVSSDIATFGVDFNKLDEHSIFGDGAAAFIIQKTPNHEASHIAFSKFITLSSGFESCQIEAGGSRYHPRRGNGDILDLSLFKMDGKAAFKGITSEIEAFFKQLLTSSHLSLEHIKKVIPHQASQLALQHLSKRLRIPSSKIMNIFPDYGNQVAASLPTALHLYRQSTELNRGDSLLLIGSGAGLCLGGMSLIY